MQPCGCSYEELFWREAEGLALAEMGGAPDLLKHETIVGG